MNILINFFIFDSDRLPLDTCRWYFRVKVFVHFTGISPSWSDAQMLWVSVTASFLVSYRFWANQFLLSCVFQRMLNMTALFYLMLKWCLSCRSICDRFFPRANFLIFTAKIWPCLHVSFLPFLLLWLLSACVLRIFYFVSTMVLNLLLHSQQR